MQELARSRPASLIGAQHRWEMLSAAIASPPGAFIEVGVYQGGTAWYLDQIAQWQERACYLCDTFTGIPYGREGLDSHKVGDFADTDVETVRRLLPYSAVLQGVFPDSVRGGPVENVRFAFAHLDCDQYQSVHEAARFLQDRMEPGGVIWFDDSPCLAGAHQAARELFGDRLRLSSLNGKHYVNF